jgi:xylulokinase
MASGCCPSSITLPTLSSPVEGSDLPMPYLIGCDVGTTNLKVVLYDVEQRVYRVFSCPTRTYYPRQGWAEYHADEIWADLVGLLHRAVRQLSDPAAVKGVAVASMGEAGLLIDAQGQPLTPIIAWFDCRTEAQSQWWKENVGQTKVYTITGHPIHPSFGVNKLMWLRDYSPTTYSKAAHWLSVEDFVLYRLSGMLATDYSIASRTMAFDIAAHQWSGFLLEQAGISQDLMTPALPGGTAIGTVTKRSAQETGLPRGTPVATGGHDHICASFAVGAHKSGSLLDSTGTSESLILTVSEMLHSPEMCRYNFAQECHVVEDRYAVLAGFPVAGYGIEWLNRVMEHGEVTRDYGLAEAAQAPPGAEGLFFLPHLRGSGSPTFDPFCRGAVIGLRPVHSRGHLLRAAVEGVCYELKSNLLALESAVGSPVEVIYATGKVTQNDLWLQTKADVTGKRLRVPQLSETAGLGAALLAGLGAGVFATPEEAVASLEVKCREVEPHADRVAFYQTQYEVFYSRIYPALKDLYHTLGADNV